MDAVAHLTCVGSTERRAARGAHRATSCAGITNLLALRGDPPGGPGSPGPRYPGACRTPTSWSGWPGELGRLHHRGRGVPRGAPGVPGPGHRRRRCWPPRSTRARPSPSPSSSSAPRTTSRWCERATEHGVTMPILPGIMPVTNVRQIERFAALSGAAFPAELAARFHAVGRRPGRRARPGHRGGHRAVREAARRRCARPALLHAQPLDGHARDLHPAHAVGLEQRLKEVGMDKGIWVTGPGPRRGPVTSA